MIREGKLYYDTGELYFEGTYDDSEWNNLKPWEPLRLIEGTEYYKNGNKYREGKFQISGLLEGREYYESGTIKFEGIFNDKHGIRNAPIDKGRSGSYYGPAYPIEGKFYAKDGTLVYEGEFRVVHQGGVGYPKVVFPEGFGSLK